MSNDTQLLTEHTSLEMHVQLCAERYSRLEEKFELVEKRIDRLHCEFTSFKGDNQTNLDEIKKLLHGAKDEKFKTIVGAAATIIVGLLGILGYLVISSMK